MTRHAISLTEGEAEASFREVIGVLRHDRESGFTLWARTGDPVMLVWSPRILEFLEVLEQTISYQPARGVCRAVGFRSGLDGARAVAEALRMTSPSPPEVLLAMPRVLAGAGWGISDLTYEDADGSIGWVFRRGTAVGAAASRTGSREAPACAFFEGFGAGWVQGSVGLDVEFLERECVGSGGSACSFVSQSLR